MSCRPYPKLRGRCDPLGPRLGNLNSVVQRYIDRHRPGGASELDAFRRPISLRDCIRQAGLARIGIGKKSKRLDHQRRIPPDILRNWASALVRREGLIHSCRSFEALHDLLDRESRRFWKNAELTVYDTALRIGAYLGLEPEQVYLHAGTREGARAMGVDRGRRTIRPRELPKAFWRLKPHEIEDCLCIYKDALKKLRF